jgi:hypothetical protein
VSFVHKLRPKDRRMLGTVRDNHPNPGDATERSSLPSKTKEDVL